MTTLSSHPLVRHRTLTQLTLKPVGRDGHSSVGIKMTLEYKFLLLQYYTNHLFQWAPGDSLIIGFQLKIGGDSFLVFCIDT